MSTALKAATNRRPNLPTKNDSGVKHNPKPSTARGKRRHEKRTDAEKAHAVKVWGA